ncbi:MAG: hypothetical protein HY691_17200 [Chloroflexi bacterium]|nr:hypothetical protein [Chloroflexota bacterium]
MAAPELYVAWINEHLGFNPRGQQNSDALSGFVTEDLQRASPRLANDLSTARLKRELNAPVRTRITERDLDLVFLDPTVSGPINRVRLAVENKTIMTAHGKARKNRYGDLIAYANHLHNHSLKAIAGAIVVINVNPIYRNPNGFATGIERNYPNMSKIVVDSVRIFTGIPLREREDEPNDQPEAVAVILVDYDGVHPGRLVDTPPAPQPGDPQHYGEFITRLARMYEARF